MSNIDPAAETNSGREIPSVTTESHQALFASYDFSRQLHPLLAARTGLTDKQLNKRVSDMFIRLCTGVAPTVVLEIGAFEASFSRRMKAALPNAQVVAYEANPFVYEHFRREVEGAGVDYRHQAAARESGTAEFRVPKDFRGLERQKVNRLSSLKQNTASTGYHDVQVEAVTIDEAFPDPHAESFVAWIDVEGACEEVLIGAEKVLTRTRAIYIEVEETAIWDGQWLDTDVAHFLMIRGFVPMARDKQKPGQFNLVLVHHSLADTPFVATQAASIYPLNRMRLETNSAAVEGNRTGTPPLSLRRRAVAVLRRAARRARSMASRH